MLLSFGRALSTRDSAVDHIFEDLFNEHYAKLAKTLWLLTGNPGTAEELASEAFCRLYQHRNQADQRASDGNNAAAGWLYRTGMNLGLDWLRANCRRIRHEDRPGREAVRRGSESGPLEDPIAEEQRRGCGP